VLYDLAIFSRPSFAAKRVTGAKWPDMPMLFVSIHVQENLSMRGSLEYELFIFSLRTEWSSHPPLVVPLLGA
jgi:hypothetical protein